MLTAIEANKLAISAKKSRLDLILASIQNAASQGNTCTTIQATLFGPTDCSALENLGYRVTFVTDPRDGNYFDIYWRDLTNQPKQQ